MTQEALKLALEALELEEAQTHYPPQWLLRAITAIKEALAQTQEPDVKLKTSNMLLRCHRCGCSDKLNIQIEYTTPPQRTWVGLTDEDICTFSMWLDDKSDVAVFTAIEAKLKEKNGYAEEKNNGV